MYKHVGDIDPASVQALADLVPPSSLVYRADSGYRLAALGPDEMAVARRILGGLVPVDEPWINARAIVIKPTGLIHLHTDPLPDGQAPNVRYHVVLATNPYAYVYHDGGLQRLPLGGVYTVDEKLEHASVNWGKQPRIHLVIDVPA